MMLNKKLQEMEEVVEECEAGKAWLDLHNKDYGNFVGTAIVYSIMARTTKPNAEDAQIPPLARELLRRLINDRWEEFAAALRVKLDAEERAARHAMIELAQQILEGDTN